MLFHPFLIEMRDMEKVIFEEYVEFVASVIFVQHLIWRHMDFKSSTSNNAFLLKLFYVLPRVTFLRLSR